MIDDTSQTGRLSRLMINDNTVLVAEQTTEAGMTSESISVEGSESPHLTEEDTESIDTEGDQGDVSMGTECRSIAGATDPHTVLGWEGSYES